MQISYYGRLLICTNVKSRSVKSGKVLVFSQRKESENKPKSEKNNTSFSVTSVKKDIRPGLIRDRSKQREVDIAAKKARIDEEYKKYTKPDPAERLLEGLNTALDSDNKGFAMLSKMGYKQGHALGKSSTAIVEPIGISLKYDRAGLGRAAAIKELQQKKQEFRRKKLLEKACGASVSTEEYRQRMVQKAEEKFIERSLEKCQRTCQKLDTKEYVKKPEMPWFWPDESKSQAKDDEHDQEEEKDEEDEYEPSEKLEMLTLYLRTSYNYCHWCGVQYEDLDDMTEDCPGPCKDDH